MDIYLVLERGKRERQRESECMCVFLYLFLSLDFNGVWRSCVICDMVRRQDVAVEDDPLKEME